MKRTVNREQYYTSNTLAKKCVDLVGGLFPLKSFDLIVEPSAGAGSFSSLLKGQRDTLFLDVEPRGESIRKGDYFEEYIDRENTLTIGNPPFGARGALAMRFILKAAQYSRVIAFILPRSFKKDTFLNRIPPHFYLVSQFDCDDFVNPGGGKLSVKCCFLVFEKRDYKRENITRNSNHEDFELKHAHMSRVSDSVKEELKEYDFAIAQVGSNFVPKKTYDVKSGSYWFVKCRQTCAKEAFSDLDFSFLDGMNTVFKSLSKKDIVQAYIAAKKKLTNS